MYRFTISSTLDNLYPTFQPKAFRLICFEVYHHYFLTKISREMVFVVIAYANTVCKTND